MTAEVRTTTATIHCSGVYQPCSMKRHDMKSSRTSYIFDEPAAQCKHRIIVMWTEGSAAAALGNARLEWHVLTYLLRLSSCRAAWHIGQQRDRWPVGSYGSNSSQVTPDPSGMFSSTFPLAVLSLLFSFCWHPCYRGLAVLAGRSLGRRNIGLYVIIIIVICSHVQAILNLRSAIMSWIPLLSALRRIYSLVMWSRYVTCSIRRRHLGWKTFSFCAILDVILHHWPM